MDEDAAGLAEAFPFANHNAGTVSSIRVYVDPHSTATQLIAGLYSASNGNPGSLVTSGSLSSATAGSWNTVPVTSAARQSGGTYRIAVLGRGGTLYFRDRDDGPLRQRESSLAQVAAIVVDEWPELAHLSHHRPTPMARSLP